MWTRATITKSFAKDSPAFSKVSCFGFPVMMWRLWISRIDMNAIRVPKIMKYMVFSWNIIPTMIINGIRLYPKIIVK